MTSEAPAKRGRGRPRKEPEEIPAVVPEICVRPHRSLGFWSQYIGVNPKTLRIAAENGQFPNLTHPPIEKGHNFAKALIPDTDISAWMQKGQPISTKSAT